MQIKMKLNTHGGKRDGAGRKRKKSRGVSHEGRERVTSRTPLHINFKYRLRVRNKDTLKLLKKAISNGRKHGLKILHFSFQQNHVHLIVDASSNEVLTRGMRSLTITFAKGLKKGRIQMERYHLHVLRTFAETRNAIRYVLFNEQRHDTGIYSAINGYSSLLNVEGWHQLVRKFAKMKRITIRIERGEMWKCDSSGSFIYKKGLELLHHDQISFT